MSIAELLLILFFGAFFVASYFEAEQISQVLSPNDNYELSIQYD